MNKWKYLDIYACVCVWNLKLNSILLSDLIFWIIFPTPCSIRLDDIL